MCTKLALFVKKSQRCLHKINVVCKNIGTLSVQELFFQLIGLLRVRLGVSPVGMVELFVHGASLTTYF